MNFLSYGYRGLILATLATACAPDGESWRIDSQRDRLTGGVVATASDVPSAVVLGINGYPHCSAAKVGPRHFLTAAHCVWSGSALHTYYSPGAQLGVSASNDLSSGFQTATIVATHVFPLWTQVTGGALAPERPADVALVVLDANTPGIEEGIIDLAPLIAGDGVILTGYGCEQGLDRPFRSDGGTARLKIDRAEVLPADAVLHAYSYIQPGQEDDLAAAYSLTEGYAKNPPPVGCAASAWSATTIYVAAGEFVAYGGRQYRSKWWTQGNTPGTEQWGPWEDLGACQSAQPSHAYGSSLCPGDSGGALYRDTPEQDTVVGVNAYYSFLYNSGGYSYTNWHARLDQESQLDVGTWLASLGAKVKNGEATVRWDVATDVVGSGGSVAPAGVTSVREGEDLVVTITADAGYEIAEVLVDGNSFGAVSSHTFADVTEGHSLTASFREIVLDDYEITSSAGVGGTIAPLGVHVVTEGDDQAFVIMADTGYQIAEVLVDNVPVVGAGASYTFEGVGGDHTISASFTVKLWDVFVSAGVGGTITNAGLNTVAHGSDFSVTITPDVGYEIASVILDGQQAAIASSYALGAVTSTRSVQVQFRALGGGCSAPAWNPSAVYPGGDTPVSHSGRTWKNKWWTTGEEPGTTGPWGVWQDLGACN